MTTKNGLSLTLGLEVAQTSEQTDQMQESLRVCIGRSSDHHNDRVSTAKNKKNEVHTLGQASNILISGERAMLLFEKAHQVGLSEIGLSQKGK